MKMMRFVPFAVVLGLFAAVPVSADLVGYFKFDEFNGMGFTDDSGQGMKGLLGLPFTEPGSVEGPSGATGDNAVSFDGQSGLLVDDSAHEKLNILTPPITLECWVRSSNNQGGHIGLISYGIPGGRTDPGGYKLGLNDGNLLFTTFGVVDVFSDIPFPFDGEWHHVAAVYGDGIVAFYLDGVEEQLIEESRDMRNPGAKELNIGTQYTAIGRFDGDIDRVRITTEVIAEGDLDSDAANPKPAGNAVAYFSFDEGVPPYTSEGADPLSTAISLTEWVIDNPPAESTSRPTISDDSPSGEADDTSLQFDGTQLAFVMDDNGVINVADDWTLEAWVRIDPAIDIDRAVLFYYGNPGHGYSVSVNFEEGDMLQVTTLGIADMPSGSATMDFDIWQHVAIAHKTGESITYFVDGQEIETVAYTGGTNPAEIQNLYIGGEWDGALPFMGWIDRIRISNSALSASELDSSPAPTSVTDWEIK